MNGVKTKKTKEKLAVMRSRSPENLKFGHFTLLFSRCCFAEDGKEMYQDVKRTCRVLFWLINTYRFVAFSLPSSLSLLKLPTVSR